MHFCHSDKQQPRAILHLDQQIKTAATDKPTVFESGNLCCCFQENRDEMAVKNILNYLIFNQNNGNEHINTTEDM